MRTVKVNYCDGVWLTTVNLWICDKNHIDTCFYNLSPVKLTSRQIRRFKKRASVHFRKGTRAQQREDIRSL